LESWSNVGRINFTLDAVTFTGKGYQDVGWAIRNEEITLHRLRPADSGEESEYAGSYAQIWKAMKVRPRSDFDNEVQSEATIVHEATQAIEDISNKVMNDWNTEVAAYLAEAVFLIERKADDEFIDGRLLKKAEKAARASLKQPVDAAQYKEGLKELRE